MSPTDTDPERGPAAANDGADAVLPPGATVLLVRLSALGDVIFALETLSTLKAERPDVRVDFLVEDRFASILRGHPLIEELIESPRRHLWRVPAHFRRLRRKHYDVILDLHGIQKSALQVLGARARLKVGYAAPASREGAGFAYHKRVHLPMPLPHRAACGLFLLRELGLDANPTSAILPTHRESLGLFPRAASGRRVLLHPGTSAFAAFKRWPTERFGDLANQLLDAGMSVVVSYGPNEAELFRAIHAIAPRVSAFEGTAHGLDGLIAAVREADVVVAADTGPLHMATAVGTRVVALFGPKDTDRYGPRGDGHVALFHPVPCRPCRRRNCVSPQCILGIDVATVFERVVRNAEAAR